MRFATYNVKDLFEAEGEQASQRLSAKLDFLAARLVEMDADVVAFQEIGSEKTLAALLDRAAALGCPPYPARVLGTADARGIACAIVSRSPFVRSRVHTAEALQFPVFVEGDPAPFGARIPLRRGIVHVEIDLSSRMGAEFSCVHVFAAHFKSRRAVPCRTASGAPIEPLSAGSRREGELRSLVWRSMEALFVRGLVDDVMVGHSGAHISVMGDLNDTEDSVVARTVMGDGPEALIPAATLAPPEERFSVLHGGRRGQIDHVLLSPGLHARARSCRFLTEGLRDHGAGAADGEMITPDSDHAPVVVEIA